MSNKAEDLVKRYVKNPRQDEKKSKEFARSDEWPNCEHAGCPLPSTIKAERVTCNYHHNQHGQSADSITEALKENLPYINKLNQLIRWGVWDWKKNKNVMLGWNVFPMTLQESEYPNGYLIRFRKWVDLTIKNRATEIYQGR